MVNFDESIVLQINSIITELLAHKKKDLYKYFKEEDFKKVDTSLNLLKQRGVIYLKSNDGGTEVTVYPYRYYDEDDIREQERLKRPLALIRYLLNLKSKDDYMYRDKIKFVMPLAYPYSLYVQIGEQLFAIIDIPKSDILNTNIIINTLDNGENINDVKRIVCTDSDDIEKINFAGIVNIFKVNKDGSVKLAK